MATPTRTIGPLHLEDLEPHRFEDMVRQLIYDFRNWRALEPTGRSGSDDGFDTRAFEIVDDGQDADEPAESDEERQIEAHAEDRVWLVQCKREKRIPPKKLVGYLEDIPKSEGESLYGIIFVGACDFSKLARDAFRAKTRELGFSEAYLWGKGEVEDMLFQPKNDHLLYAYFGISLQTRRRRLKSDVRSRLAIKRKAVRLLADHEREAVLVRDASDDRYPYLDEDTDKRRVDRGRWTMLTYAGCFHDGLHFVTRRHFAFIDEDGEHWDYAETMDDSRPHSFENPWHENDDEEERRKQREIAMDIWSDIPDANRAWFEIVHVLPYENILDIDEAGDDWIDKPHIYTNEFHPLKGPFREYVRKSLKTIDRFAAREASPDKSKRVRNFPRSKQDKKSNRE
jgi:hypothetical protein